MRWPSLFLITLFTLGQTHLCEANYVLPSGQVCLTCPTLKDAPEPDNHSGSAEISERHGDCHDCCTIEACDDSSKTILLSAAVKTFDLPVLVVPFISINLPLAPRMASVGVYIDSAPPTGPPSERSSRGPPMFYCSRRPLDAGHLSIA